MTSPISRLEQSLERDLAQLSATPAYGLSLSPIASSASSTTDVQMTNSSSLGAAAHHHHQPVDPMYLVHHVAAVEQELELWKRAYAELQEKHAARVQSLIAQYADRERSTAERYAKLEAELRAKLSKESGSRTAFVQMFTTELEHAAKCFQVDPESAQSRADSSLITSHSNSNSNGNGNGDSGGGSEQADPYLMLVLTKLGAFVHSCQSTTGVSQLMECFHLVLKHVYRKVSSLRSEASEKEALLKHEIHDLELQVAAAQKTATVHKSSESVRAENDNLKKLLQSFEAEFESKRHQLERTMDSLGSLWKKHSALEEMIAEAYQSLLERRKSTVSEDQLCEMDRGIGRLAAELEDTRLKTRVLEQRFVDAKKQYVALVKVGTDAEYSIQRGSPGKSHSQNRSHSRNKSENES
eukprot:ANDGO_05802.mRNA.1 hypothetical protein